MEIISSKMVSCETEKVLYKVGESYRNDIEKRKKDGWKVVCKPSWWDAKMEMVSKHASNGTVLTYIRYGHINIA